jgi:hypothetical protein
VVTACAARAAYPGGAGPALVQGAAAPASLVAALEQLYARAASACR